MRFSGQDGVPFGKRACMLWSADCSLHLVGWCARMISSTWVLQPAQKHVWTCSSGVMYHPLCAVENNCKVDQHVQQHHTEQMLQQHHPDPQISCYILLLCRGRMLDSGCSLRVPAYLLVLFCNGFERKGHLVSSSARILKMHINGSLWEFINIFNLMYDFEATRHCVTGNNILGLGISV